MISDLTLRLTGILTTSNECAKAGPDEAALQILLGDSYTLSTLLSSGG